MSRSGQPFSIGNEIPVRPHASLAQCPAVPFVVVPEVNLPPGARLAPIFREEIAWLQQRYAAGAVLAAGCSGPMLFAEAGLLDGQHATAHWAWCDVLRERFPRVQVHARRTLVVSGEQQRLVMAGGGQG